MSPLPVADPFVEGAEILLERRPGDLARETRILVTEHVERHHHLAVAGVAGVAPGLAVALDQGADRTDRDRHQRIALAAGELEGLRGLGGGDIELGARRLRRPRQRGDVLEGMELAAMGGMLPGQQELDLLEALTETCIRFVGEMPKRRNSCGRNARAKPTSSRPPEMPSSMAISPASLNG